MDERASTDTPNAAQGTRTSTRDQLREDIRRLRESKLDAQISERSFRRTLLALSRQLARCEAVAAMDPDEHVLAEHHVDHANMKLTEALLREPEHASTSWFATNRGLVRVRATLALARGETGDTGMRITVDGIAYDQVKRMTSKAEWRWAEVLTGFIIVVVALLLRHTLTLMAPVLMLAGAAGFLHGLLLPTRWIEIMDAGSVEPVVTIHGLWRRSARKLLSAIRAGLRARAGTG